MRKAKQQIFIPQRCSRSHPGQTGVVLFIILSVLSWSVGSVTAGESTNPILKILISQRDDPVVSPQLQKKMAQCSADERLVVWVFFTDKGLFTESDYESALKQVTSELSERVRRRREKMGLPNLANFRDLPVNRNYIKQVTALSSHHRTTSKWLNAVSVEALVSGLAEISQLPFVRKIQEVARSRHTPVPDSIKEKRPSQGSPSSPNRYGLDYGSSLNQLQQINVPAVHDLGYDGSGIIICLLDTGFFLEHEALEHIDLIAEWDFIFRDGNTANEEADSPSQQQHGTEVLSIVGGAMDGKLYGPAYRAGFLLAKTEDTRSETPVEEDYWVAGIEWGESMGADVVSSSVGYSDWYTYEEYDGNTALTTKAADIAAFNGIVVCNAMGNSGHAVGSIVAPADADSIIACGAVDGNGMVAAFSSIGPTFDGRTKPEVVARGASTYAVLPSPLRTDGYAYLAGTSFSTPLVAGCAALVLQAHPDWTPMQVREALMMTASHANNPNNSYGWGIVDCLKAINGGTDDDGEPILPERFVLAQNYPNPFNPMTDIRYQIPDVGSPVHTTLTIFNILGQEVTTLVDDVRDAGSYTVSWNGLNAQGTRVASGVYVYRIVANGMFQGDRDEFTATKRMLLLK